MSAFNGELNRIYWISAAERPYIDRVLFKKRFIWPKIPA